MSDSTNLTTLEDLIGARLGKQADAGNALTLDILLLTGIYYELVEARRTSTSEQKEPLTDEHAPPAPAVPRRTGGRARKTT